jgi:hypothetical protein
MGDITPVVAAAPSSAPTVVITDDAPRQSMSLSDAQDACLKLIGLSGTWNAFDGPTVEAALRSRQDLWRAAFFGSETIPMSRSTGFLGLRQAGWRLRDMIDLVVLRDLPTGAVALSTLFLLAVPGRQDDLYSLATGWDADEVQWIAQDEAFEAMGESPDHDSSYASDPSRVILRCWWD